ncbi:testis-expressed protein 2 isoform X2 [Leptinotarsa decemlineata]|uniref:testis-expressed protein 2 isoform X2 n=1 Tax=Leptinotarsa decemlineata TaxID=7539 RepID=UPI003D3099B8
MNNRNDRSKISLGMLKGKSATTSVPSISIKFHANAEQIEELYASDDETSKQEEKSDKVSTATSVPVNIGEHENSPLKYFNRLGKRSSSIDVSAQSLDASPPSDPWRFFSDIKGKITKSVEEKITEIKARNQDEGSPQHKVKTELPTVKDSKECSSVSDSEDLSESSISKTCGIVSTTEGVEMSSDEDTPSIEKDRKSDKSSPLCLRQRFRFFKKNHSEEGTVKINDLSKLHNITTESAEQALPEETEGVENAIDALEESNLDDISMDMKISNDNILRTVVQKIDNLELDNDNVVIVREVLGDEMRERYFDCNQDIGKTVFAPSGFVDLRPKSCHTVSNNFSYLILFVSVAIYIIIHYYSSYFAGLAAGIILSFVIFKVYSKLYLMKQIAPARFFESSLKSMTNTFFEVEAVKEYQPLLKYEGWANEYPDVYNPKTYHISHTQSVYLRLQANLLRISHAKNKVPKRAMWNESEIKANFTHHRIYNLFGAKITLLPEGLTKIRQWSKKYPICITLSKDQMNFEPDMSSVLNSDIQNHLEKDKINLDKDKNLSSSPREKKGFRKYRKRDYSSLAQRFSKLAEDEEIDLDSDSRASTPSAEMSDVAETPVLEDEDILDSTSARVSYEKENTTSDLAECSLQENIPTGIQIYIFGRTDREKEDWFRRLAKATHIGLDAASSHSSNSDIKETGCDTCEEIVQNQTEVEYLRYMNMFKTSRKESAATDNKDTQDSYQEKAEEAKEQLWLNALIGRVLFDCFRDPNFITKVKDRIQRKLSAIKLPYFIEEILIPELSLGKTSPLIKKIGEPLMDDRGMWIDLNVTYEGMIVLTLQTKINLMRLKNPQAYEKSVSEERSAIYHSDIDDSAESSSDEEGSQEVPNIPADTASGSGHSGKKLIKMVDRITESKFFQAATENRYIKKAMEGVSNTDLRLTVEVKAIVGTLVLNIPPPPSDRIWVGFRPVPEISLSARPIVGERNISYIMVTSWIEKKLVQEFQKVMVIPNMEDLLIPVMNSKLPE